jgi:O-antigen ligase
MKIFKSKILYLFREIAYVNILTIQMTFYAFNSLLGFKYGGIQGNSLYMITSILSSVICYLFIFFDLLKMKKVFGISVFLFSIPLFLILNYFLSQEFNPVNNLSIQLFFLFSFPSLLIGYIVGYNSEINFFRRGFIFVSLLISFAIIKISNDLYTANFEDFDTIFGGASYQTLSYTCAFCYSIILFNYLYPINARLSFNVIFESLSLFFLLALFAAIILSGGRGGAVVAILNTFLFILFRYKIKGIFIFSLTIFFLFSLVIINSSFYEVFLARGTRVFSYISGSGIDVSETSGRDEIWEFCMAFIYKKPLFGYGIFSYTTYLGPFYPHNFFLEVFVQGGIFYFIFWLFVLVIFFLKLRIILIKDKKNILLLTTVVTSFSFLSFSGTYLQSGLFWFSLMVVLFFRFKPKTLELI